MQSIDKELFPGVERRGGVIEEDDRNLSGRVAMWSGIISSSSFTVCMKSMGFWAVFSLLVVLNG